MRVRHARFVVSALTAVFTVAACASTEEIPPPQKTEPAPQPSAVPASTSKPAEPPAKKCVAKCKMDSECANSCPVTNSGIHCCDVSTGTCYVNGSGTCPKAQDPTDPSPSY